MSPISAKGYIKIARLVAEMPYPPISAWEFKTLGRETAVQEKLRPATVYIIAQRPLLWFDKVVSDDHSISFEITDGISPPLACRLDPVRIGLCEPGGALDIEFGWHREPESKKQPLTNVAAIKVFDAKAGFKVWWSPQKLLFEHLVRGLPVSITGDASAFTTFEVHYIGQAFSQTIWDRLKPHEKYKQVLIDEDVRGGGHARPSLEITLFTLAITGVDELKAALDEDDLIADAPPPILFGFPDDETDTSYISFHKPWVALGDAALTTELEAMLINLFKPAHNSIKFNGYPLIKGGLRDLGFTEAELRLEEFPFTLTDKTGHVPLLEGEDES